AIPIGARLVALTDSLNGMLHARPHRPALSLQAAMEEIERLAGQQFCPRLVGPFVAEVRAQADLLAGLQEPLAGRREADAPAAHPAPTAAGR
ncbi:MAG: HD-GYP domain-containing protein, partial [Actinomycetota bacterium]